MEVENAAYGVEARDGSEVSTLHHSNVEDLLHHLLDHSDVGADDVAVVDGAVVGGVVAGGVVRGGDAPVGAGAEPSSAASSHPLLAASTAASSPLTSPLAFPRIQCELYTYVDVAGVAADVGKSPAARSMTPRGSTRRSSCQRGRRYPRPPPRRPRQPSRPLAAHRTQVLAPHPLRTLLTLSLRK